MHEELQPRILVVDDQEENLDLLEGVLVPRGYRVVRARSGAEALEAVAKELPDLILLDIQMPQPDGLEVCRRLKEDEKTRLIPIVMVTVLGELGNRVQAIEAGADDFVTKPFHRVELEARVRSLLKLKQFTDELESAETVLFTLALTVEAKDPYTEGHCERLAGYTIRLGKRLGLPSEYLTALRRAGFLHDLGKIAIPEAILLKPGPLAPAEWEMMRQHPIIGERICKPLRSLRLTLPAIRHHHERWDGSGYPDGLRGEEIPLTARILQVVDVYDALITDRPYQPALSPAHALEVLLEEADRGWWDPALVKEFVAMIQEDLAAPSAS